MNDKWRPEGRQGHVQRKRQREEDDPVFIVTASLHNA